MNVDRETVRAAAIAVGVEPSEETLDRLVSQVRTTAEQVDRFEPSVPEAEPAAAVREGTDEYNAFAYEFETGDGTGALDDLTLAVKDNTAVSGVPMTCGSDAVAFTPTYDSTVVRRLKEGGATVVGTTNMDEFALTTTGETCAHGPVENPVVEGRVPGGSSSGSAAAVAAGLVDAALGSDTGGSVRIPAAWCGVVGLKPTHRSVSRFGFADLAPSLDHVGPLAPSVETACRVFDEIDGPDVHDPSTHVSRPPSNVRTAVGQPVDDLSVAVVEEAMSQTEPAVRSCVRETIETLESAGVSVATVSLPAFPEMSHAALTVANTEFAALFASGGQVRGTGTGHAEPWREAVASIDRSDLGEDVRSSLVVYESLYRATDGANYVAAQNERRRFVQSVFEFLADTDALVMPTTTMAPPEFGEVTDTADVLATIANTAPFNLTGHPALSVPCGAVDGAPVGLQLVADWHEEPVLARLGSAVEAAD